VHDLNIHRSTMPDVCFERCAVPAASLPISPAAAARP
jgi:hypothetical protein